MIRPPLDLMFDGVRFGRITSYGYDQPWAMGRFEPADVEMHRRLVESCELAAEIEQWPDLAADEDERRWNEALERRGLVHGDTGRLHDGRWTIRLDAGEREVFPAEFDRAAFVTWRW
jgi:hypothetical protein